MKTAWEVRPLGEVCTLATGGTPKRSESSYFEGGKIKWLVSGDIHQKEIHDCEGRITELGLATSNARYLPKNSVMIALNGQGKTRGAVALLRTKATCNQSLVSIMPNNSEKLLPEFLFANLHGRYEEIRKMTGDSGNDRRGLNMPLIRSIEIPIPPLEEQKQIVAVLDAAFEGLTRAKENAETNLQNARELFESYISDRLKEMNATEISLSEMIDAGWITSHLDGNHGSNYPKKAEFTESGVPYASANCIVDGEIDLSLAKHLPAERADTLVKGTAHNLDVIFAHNATVGPVAVLETDEERVLLGTSVTHYRCDPQFLNPYFLCFEMRGSEFVRQYQSVMGQATRNQVPITIQRKFTHRIPDLQSQLKLATDARSVEAYSKNLVSNYQAKLQDIADLRQSLLQKAFAGELT
ncbi:restriction endonuclease subunit S [Rhodobacteraceae bacterium B1Z28]|uniref:Restriction endonuclease subunit S n=1 Tax=Ruegeria haliotis TaxID=2747601 RepID=A0ABX2PU26_9RHOB|nr:restriction endonuclease subunit S [Ruegeria haliotis]NVO57200.1 restriction endonuclease subunit S [Ruegeria haliotis]